MARKSSILPCGLPSYPTWESRDLPNMFALITALLILGSLLCAKAQDYGTIDAGELEALFEVLDGLNQGADWKAQIPEPCGGWSESIYCEPDNVTGEYHVIDLKFGTLSDEFDLIGCSGQAILHPSVGKLKFLWRLQIFNCFVDEVASIPKEIGQLHDSLQVLVLQDNPGLVGTIPDELGNLISLERLVITMTGIGGSIPESMGDLLDLQQLDLSRNRLQGSVPVSMNSLRSLKILDLGQNQLSGGLPSLSGMQSLLKMVLRANHLNGTIPDAISLLKSLTLLDLSYNSFVGGLPPSFSELKSLEDLHLGHNEMKTFLPDFLDTMPALSLVDLAHSGYEGDIPSSFGKMLRLCVLILKENHITGMIPASLQSLRYLYQLDLSSNNLTGPVPFATEFLNKMGSNLLILNNTGLCIPHTTLRLTVPSVGVDPCLDTDHVAAYSGVPSESPPPFAEEPETLHRSNAPSLPQRSVPLLPMLILSILLYRLYAGKSWGN